MSRDELSDDKRAGIRRRFEQGDRAIPEHEINGCVACAELRRLEAESAPDPWAAGVAEQVRGVLVQTPQQWLDPRDFAHVYRYSDDQAGHILRRAFEYGALERTKEGRRFVYRPAVAGAGHIGDVPLSASEPIHNPKAGR